MAVTKLLGASLLLSSVCAFATTRAAPANLQIIDSKISYCDIPISTQRAPNDQGFTITYDTAKSTGLMPVSLASTDAENTTETTCLVCASFKWSNNLYGSIMSVEYDFWHKLEPGSLEQVASYITMENATRDEYFESLYTYGSEDTMSIFHTQTTLINASEPLILDYTRDHEEVCVQTAFRVISRGGWEGGARAEISRSSVFVQSVNIEWAGTKP
ncbi:hypothetical protein P154DRAFT_582459 [Amniculicola lignicola CBS 123094]|uniref:Uncharacterized protein n=1 Tax=Amniculicola lignicola CBS 123094 TaxID=1392246 RepID=A0A6A5VYJ4_9PLEO|nr:hypothetical protein P154DRAFT_582459 [Amniculicola lignicola CBS 123094]